MPTRVDILRASDLIVVTPPTSASFVYKGLTGSLNHCLITPNLVGFVDAHRWNINSGEPAFLQYDAAGPDTDVKSPFRSSDHDPVLIGVNFAGLAPGNTSAACLYMYRNLEGGARPFALPELPAGTAPISLEIALPQGAPMPPAARRRPAAPGPAQPLHFPPTHRSLRAAHQRP